MPEPLRKLEPREAETRKMHAWAEYGLMQVKLSENIARLRRGDDDLCDYPVLVNGRYAHGALAHPEIRQSEDAYASPALQLFGAGREKRIYAIRPIPA